MNDSVKLLVVDDEREFLEAMAERLELRGLEVRTAENGESALALCAGEKFDIALVDLKMPGMDGHELLARLKAEHRHLEVIVLTGHGSSGSAFDCAKSGAFAYLPKPYEIDDLMAVVRDAYRERLARKLATNRERLVELARVCQGATVQEILIKMREMDDGER